MTTKHAYLIPVAIGIIFTGCFCLLKGAIDFTSNIVFNKKGGGN